MKTEYNHITHTHFRAYIVPFCRLFPHAKQLFVRAIPGTEPTTGQVT